VSTLRDWEQGRKQPDSAAITLIKVRKSIQRYWKILQLDFLSNKNTPEAEILKSTGSDSIDFLSIVSYRDIWFLVPMIGSMTRIHTHA